MASLLWTKSDKRRPIIYVDLFDNVSTELQIEFVRWEQKLWNFDWNHRFFHYYSEPTKCQATAKRFGSIGNTYFESREWRIALEMYNQAICFAENDSSYLAVLFAKRGFCFSNLEMYSAGTIDIDIALSRNLPRELVAECRAINEVLKQKSEQRTPNRPQLSFNECDENYPAMANVLELKLDENNRAYIAAKVDIDVGETVLVEQSFAAVTNGYNKICCATCLQEMKNFLPCRTCTDAAFCSVDCFQRNNVHRKSCGEDFHHMPTPIKFVIQSILHAISIFPTVDFLMQFVEVYIKSPNFIAAATIFKTPLDEKMRNYGLFLKLSTQNDLPIVTAFQAYTTLLTMKSISEVFNSEKKKRFLMHLVGHHTFVLKCNSFGGFEKNENQFISGTMANLVGLIDHSCTPNVIHFTYGDRVVCMTIRPIRAGERLCYDYFPMKIDVDDDKRRKQRKQLIWQHWHIDCKCCKCNTRNRIISNPQMAADPAFYFVSFISTYKLNGNRQSKDNNQVMAQLKEKCIQFLRKFKDEPWAKETEIIINIYTKCILSITHTV